MENKKTFKELYDDLLEISQVDTCECNKERDKQLAELLIKFKIKQNGSITPEEEEYIKTYPLMNYYSLGKELFKDKTLDQHKRMDLCKKLFKLNTISKSTMRRLEHQL